MKSVFPSCLQGNGVVKSVTLETTLHIPHMHSLSGV